MKRRESINKISAFLSLAISFPSLAGLLEGCSEKKPPLWAPLKLNEKQQALISAIADQVIPKTETPSASEAGVPAFIEILLKDVFLLQDARGLLQDLKHFNENCKSETGHTFLKCTSEQKYAWMKSVANPSHSDHSLFAKMSDLVVGAYFTSEIGMKENLDYLPIPGKFETCTKMKTHAKIMVGDRV